MAEKTLDRSEQREEIKLKLEYLRLVTSVAVITTLVFGGLQWRIANQAAEFANKIATENAYGRIEIEWRDHLKTFVDRPHLRPYFEEMKQLSADDSNKQAVLGVADIRLDVMDAILTYAAMRDPNGQIGGWKDTFSRAFKTSPILCMRLNETSTNYGLIVPIAHKSCGP
jgi:hypothetical protein